MLYFKNWLLSEMPINNAQLLGNWDNFKGNKHQNWDKASYNILTSPNSIEKFKSSWSKTEQIFDIYFLKKRGTKGSLLQREVDEDYLKMY